MQPLARYLGTSGVPLRIQELNTAKGQYSGSVVAVTKTVLVLKIVVLKIVLEACRGRKEEQDNKGVKSLL